MEQEAEVIDVKTISINLGLVLVGIIGMFLFIRIIKKEIILKYVIVKR